MSQVSDGVFLREDVYFEPLLFNWYAWPYLLAPICGAMNFTGRNLRLMKSFVNNARVHIAANKQPGLVGGDFVDCDESQIDDVRALVERIESRGTIHAIRESIVSLNALLAGQVGMSLEPLYEKIPEPLRGYVELIYDSNHHASFRLIEGLVYAGDLYDESAQSISLGLLGKVTKRPFVLSSPRFPDANHLHLDIRFSDDMLDELFAARTRPVSMARMRDLLGPRLTGGGLQLEDLFTPTPPGVSCPPLESDLRIRFTGHAGLLLETAQTRVLVDPVIASRDAQHGDEILSFSELPDVIDYICLTHSHMDHVCIETLLQLRHKTRQILVPKNSGGLLYDPSLKLMLQALGFKVRECEDMEELPCPGGKIRALPFLGEHADLNVRSKAAWHFELAGKTIFAGADSSSLDDVLYRRIQRVIGNLDYLFIGMECVGAPMSWLYGALFTQPIPRAINESRRFNGSDFQSARKLVEIFSPGEVYVYALGLEPWFRYFMGLEYSENARQIVESDLLIEFCTQRDIPVERLTGRRRWDIDAGRTHAPRIAAGAP